MNISQLTDEMLLSVPLRTPHGFFEDLKRKADAQGVEWRPADAVEYWWWLARIGAIALLGQSPAAGLSGVQGAYLTDRGRSFLERGSLSPHDPQRFYETIRKRMPNADDIVMVYVVEAVETWGAGCARASLVMLGCACERLILLLAEDVSDSAIHPLCARIQKSIGNYAKQTQLSRLFDDVLVVVRSEIELGKLPGAIGDAVERKLVPVFEYARGWRNKTGHPSGAEVSLGEAEAGLLLFPSFLTVVSDLSAHFRVARA